MKKYFLLLLLMPLVVGAQEDLLDELAEHQDTTYVVKAAFKGLKIVNFESTKIADKNDLYFIVSHRFGSVKNGIDDFFGLDNAVTRLQFVYSMGHGFQIGISRSSFQQTYEASLKYRLVQQRSQGFPFTIVGFYQLSINTFLDENIKPDISFSDRLTNTIQVLASRKFSEKFSLQLMPTFFHENYVFYEPQEKSQFALGFGGRYKLGKRWSINADYGVHLNRADGSPYNNPLSIGVDLETGGHVFQMHFSNAQPMHEAGYLGQATGDWGDGDIYFGFNLSRVF
ncbi:DUF5777 family beta-barrel protein [Galbibacter sp. EGI 63066]|uniref:DUF5777 family beta-barrel protein n=1 Tax=Galbibacter sp. EGI 63066 TaxID=2993559 RepID=UPI0022491EFD|nr:DUF5777 family beta-barrel protein [Galbibacter sp. EGI 63066]MCX2679314.1 DUF5777 family beta-barrel protein [Galbibacter sp. EGI 63066]